MGIDRDTMLRLLRGELSEEDARRHREAIGADSELAAEFRRLERMEGILRAGVAESFGPYFSDRVMKRLLSRASVGRAAFYDALQWAFLRLAAASLIIVVGLGVYAAIDSRESELASSTIEAVFGLPSTDLENVFFLQGI
jgi:anti-sigma factor RsiW